MTTPEGPTGAADQADDGQETTRRRRRDPARMRPIRSGADIAAASGSAASPTPIGPDETISEVVAQAVHTGYDVIAKNIKQGRVAAEKFRDGKYNIRDVPGDVGTASLNVLELARQLSQATFDICERLLKELAASPSTDRTTPPPVFRPSPIAPRTPAPKPAPAEGLKVTCRFKGAAGAVAGPAMLTRPQTPTAPEDIFSTPLSSPVVGTNPISDVAFSVDASVEGLVAKITVPEGQPAGVYSGIVYAKGAAGPLGILTIQIPAA
jgi:hypothetical protein